MLDNTFAGEFPLEFVLSVRFAGLFWGRGLGFEDIDFGDFGGCSAEISCRERTLNSAHCGGLGWLVVMVVGRRLVAF